MKCKVLPHKIKKVLSAQSLSQKIDWGVQALNIPVLWGKTSGEGTVVAVIDSGVDLEHPDLMENLLEGANFINKRNKPKDDYGHGTHCSGIIAATNNEIGVVGVAPKCKILPIKVLDKYGDGNFADVARGISYAIERKVDAICMSLGSPTPLASVRKAIIRANQCGIPTFVAGGNLGKSEHLLFPAAYPETISIGAFDKKFDRAKFSMTGSNLDFIAPGVDILSTIPPHWYGIMSGTSQAAPFIVGLAMLALSYTRNKNSDIKLKCADDYRNLFKKYTKNIVSEQYAGDKFYQGYGIITPDKLFESL